MAETKRIAEEVNRMGQEARDQAKRVGQEFQRTARAGLRPLAYPTAKSMRHSRRWPAR